MLATKIEDTKREEGFTLIELLVVVIIIGILAAIAIPTFLNQRERGWQAELTSDVRNAALDVEAAAVANNGVYPNTPTLLAGSPDTTLTYQTNGTDFCILGVHTRINGGTNSINYQASTGGLGPFSDTSAASSCVTTAGTWAP